MKSTINLPSERRPKEGHPVRSTSSTAGDDGFVAGVSVGITQAKNRGIRRVTQRHAGKELCASPPTDKPNNRVT